VITTPQTITPTAVVCCENNIPNTAMPRTAHATCHLRSKRSADQWPDRRGDGHDESVGERFRHLDPLRDEQRDHPAREA
jgi:hypothetical protein